MNSTQRPAPPLPQRPPARHQRILDLLADEEVVEVSTLARSLGVSAVTVRTDLDALEKRHLVRRVRGGAMALRPGRFERPLDLPGHFFSAEKERIAAAAAAMVRDGETVILDAGTTTLALARSLRPDLTDVVVVTNGLAIALALLDHPGITTLVTGGRLRQDGWDRGIHSLIAPLSTLLLREINADALFLCCGGIDPVRGVTNGNWEAAEVKHAMLAAARRAVVVADHGKLGHVGSARVAPLSRIDLLVTDSGAPAAEIAALEAAGLRVHLA